MRDDPEAPIVVAALRLYVLFAIFDGQPSTWLDFLIAEGSLRQIEDDLPFVASLENAPRTRLMELAKAYDLLCQI